MTIHMIKLCVGADSIDDLARWQQIVRDTAAKAGTTQPVYGHTTFQTPKRQDDLLDGGSLYWVIKGVIQVRQLIAGFDEGRKADGSACCVIRLKPDLIPVRPVARRPFQGWRYLSLEDAPPDLGANENAKGLADLPPKMRKELAALGLL